MFLNNGAGADAPDTRSLALLVRMSAPQSTKRHGALRTQHSVILSPRSTQTVSLCCVISVAMGNGGLQGSGTQATNGTLSVDTKYNGNGDVGSGPALMCLRNTPCVFRRLSSSMAMGNPPPVATMRRRWTSAQMRTWPEAMDSQIVCHQIRMFCLAIHFFIRNPIC